MMKRLRPYLYTLAGIVIGAVAVATLAFRESNDAEETVEVKPDGRLQYKWFVPDVPKSLAFAGEKVPIDRWDIREQLDRELLYNYYNQYSTLYILRLTTRYFPMIEQKLKANGIPEDFKYLCVAESALRNQTSSAGAVGFWQFMPGTAPSYGLTVNDEVDERYDVEKATEAACKYFRDGYNKFGSWTAAAASYNCGMGGYNKFATQQQTRYYYDMLLPEETMRYVFRILAFKLLIGQSDNYGYVVQGADAYKPYNAKTITVSNSIPDLAQFAIDNGTTYKTLKLLNPWLRSKSLTVKGKSYEILLPRS